jgi:hypothetical protein
VSFDTLLGLAGLAVGIGALVPLYFSKGGKLWITTIIIAVFLMGISGLLVYQRTVEGRELASLEVGINDLLSGDNPLTFEQIYDHLNYTQYASAVRAIDELMDSHKIRADRVDVTSPSGKTFSFRVYNNIKYPSSINTFVATKGNTKPAADSGTVITPDSGPAPHTANGGCPVSLPAYDSPTMGGGHTQAEVCDPKFLAYTQTYPNCVIGMSVMESNHKSIFGQVTYQYHCAFSVRPK